MTKLLIATNNPGKLREYQEILADLPFTLTWPKAEGLTLEPEETGQTFRENAIIKATAFARASGLLTLADDSGLEIDALHGEPGVYSARYRLVLEKLTGIPHEQRTARFRCVVAVAKAEQLIGTAEGAIEGAITDEPRGHNGFGYDPIFFVPEFNCTMAEMTSTQKHSISHRARAVRAAWPLLEQTYRQT